MCWFVFLFICYLLLNLILSVFILVLAETIAGAVQVLKALESLPSLTSPPEVSGTSQVWEQE